MPASPAASSAAALADGDGASTGTNCHDELARAVLKPVAVRLYARRDLSGRCPPPREDPRELVEHRQRGRRRPLRQLGIEPDVGVTTPSSNPKFARRSTRSASSSSAVVSSPPSPIAKGLVA